ncbi:MAG: T9SS type A sorting domain-containing protein [candidate division WOR-3 bacterium]|nr:T9SS type A sorting domain-containing protein [candidate division WOR-3 bacterium]
MYIFHGLGKYFPVLLIFVSANLCAQDIYFVASSNTPLATAYNNSHKIATKYEEYQNDTIYVVFQSSDSIYFVSTSDEGISWAAPFPVCAGEFPALDICPSGFRHVAWQSSDNDIYYDCLDDWSPPVNVSGSPEQSSLPDLVVDSNNVKHITWVEHCDGRNQIYYRTIANGILGDTVCISGYGSSLATYDHPSISIFAPDNRIYVIWECYDSLCYSPYQIHLRYAENNVWSPTRVWAHYLPMRHPSIDYSHGQPQDTLSFCYEDSTNGTMQATFYGGNGGGYQTQGYSTYPVVSTVGPTWSYQFWQEDLAGDKNILYDLYYFFSGWSHGGIDLQEPVRFPNVCGAYMVWTQGDTIPYSIYFANFGYPIGIQEYTGTSRANLSARPNPFSHQTDIRYSIPEVVDSKQNTVVSFKIYDSMGRLVKSFAVLSPGIGYQSSVKWFGDDHAGNELPAGVYWCYVTGVDQGILLKVIKVD